MKNEVPPFMVARCQACPKKIRDINVEIYWLTEIGFSKKLRKKLGIVDRDWRRVSLRRDKNKTRDVRILSNVARCLRIQNRGEGQTSKSKGKRLGMRAAVGNIIYVK